MENVKDQPPVNQPASVKLSDVKLSEKRMQRLRPIRSLSALSASVLFLAGVSLPAVAQAKSLSTVQVTPQKTSQPIPHAGQFSESAQTNALSEAALHQMVAEIIAAETQDWSPSEKAALKELEALNLKTSELEAIAQLSANELDLRLKTDKKLSKLSTAGLSSEQALKLAPMMLLSRYLLNIGRAALWGGVVGAIRSADFDYRALTVALTSGDTRQFMSLLREGLSDQSAFTDLVGSAATFACGSATLETTPRMCDRFANGMTKIFGRVERSGERRSQR